MTSSNHSDRAIPAGNVEERIALAILNSDRAMAGLPAAESRDEMPDSDGYVVNARAVLAALNPAARAPIADEAKALVERLREGLSVVAVSDEAPALRIAFSAGITSHRAGEHTDQTVQRADEALYEAKSAGRHRSVVA